MSEKDSLQTFSLLIYKQIVIKHLPNWKVFFCYGNIYKKEIKNENKEKIQNTYISIINTF